MNKCMFIGRLGQDCEVRYTKSGDAVGSFSICVSEKYTDKTGQKRENVEWIRCTLWKRDKLFQYLTKGTQVFVCGKYTTSKYQDKNGIDRYSTTINVTELELLGNKSANDGQYQTPNNQPQYQTSNNQPQFQNNGPTFGNGQPSPPQQQWTNNNRPHFPTTSDAMDDAPF